MSFKNNSSKFYFLLNKPVLFWDEESDKKFEIVLPTLEEFYTNKDLLFCIELLEKDLKDLKKIIQLDFDSHYQFLYLIFVFATKFKEYEELKNSIFNGLKIIIPDLKFENIFKVKEVVLDEKTFNEIIDIVLLSMGREIERILPEDDEFTRIEKEAKIRANKIRSSSKNNENKNGTSIEDLIASILYEYPQYRIEDIMRMNLYTVYYLFRYVGKIANYEVSKIAAGNGLAKKHQYFIEK